MEVKSKSKYLRISPRKVRKITYSLQGKSAVIGLDSLRLFPHKGAKLLSKTLKTAIADAEHNFQLKKENLKIKTIQVDQASILKRFRAGARGMAKPISKRMSHITFILEGEEKLPEVKKPKETPPVKAISPIKEEKPKADAKGAKVKEEKATEKFIPEKPKPVIPKEEKETPYPKPREGFLRKIFRRKSI